MSTDRDPIGAAASGLVPVATISRASSPSDPRRAYSRANASLRGNNSRS